MPSRVFALTLALLVGVGLFFAVGPIDRNDSTVDDRVTSSLERKAVRIARRSVGGPRNAKLSLATMQAWIEAGNDRLGKINLETEPIPGAVAEDFKSGLEAWNRYLEQTDGEASADIAELASWTFFNLMEIGSTDPREIEANAAGAARAQKIACRHQVDLITLSNLALYEYFNREFRAGDRAAEAATTDVSGAAIEDVKRQLKEFRERGERFTRRVTKAAERLRESGEERLKKPIKAFGSGGRINTEEE